MGEHVNRWTTTVVAGALVGVVTGLNVFLIVQQVL
jgi:Mn2+/Fe2+ NRAMP family transporter